MGDDGEPALGRLHHVLQHQLPLGDALVDALAGGAAHVHALDALLDQERRELADRRGADLPVPVIAGVKRGKYALILLNVLHFDMFSFYSSYTSTLNTTLETVSGLFTWILMR